MKAEESRQKHNNVEREIRDDCLEKKSGLGIRDWN